jgi:hypothetical protein
MTRRMLILLVCAILAALPLIWFNVDPRAGQILLEMTR